MDFSCHFSQLAEYRRCQRSKTLSGCRRQQSICWNNSRTSVVFWGKLGCVHMYFQYCLFWNCLLIRHYNPFGIGSLFKNGIYYYILFLSLLFVESRSCQLFPLSKWKTETRQTWKQLKDYCRFTVGWVNENDLCKTQWCCSNDKSHDPLCTSRVTKPITVQMLHDDW